MRARRSCCDRRVDPLHDVDAPPGPVPRVHPRVLEDPSVPARRGGHAALLRRDAAERSSHGPRARAERTHPTHPRQGAQHRTVGRPSEPAPARVNVERCKRENDHLDRSSPPCRGTSPQLVPGIWSFCPHRVAEAVRALGDAARCRLLRAHGQEAGSRMRDRQND